MANSFTGSLTGGLIDPGSPDYGKLAGKNEQRRQQIINLGLRQINSIFGGGSAPFYTAANTGTNRFDPTQQYYSLSTSKGFTPYWTPSHRPEGTFKPSMGASILAGNDPGTTQLTNRLIGNNPSIGERALAGAVTPNPLGPLGGILGGVLGGIFGKTESPQDIATKAFKRNQLLNAPTYQTFEGFQDPFFEKRAQDYVNFALPQEAQQYQTNRLAMLYGLANRGLGQSSVATQAHSNLERAAGEAKQNIADTALQQANQLRQDVENARQESIKQLYQTADPAQATAQAISSAAGFARPATFAPIANMFGNLATQYYTNQLLNNYRQPYGVAQDQGLNLSGALGPVTIGM